MRFALALLAWIALAAPALAHTASRSFSAWTIDGARLDGVVETDARRVTQLAGIVPGTDFSTLLSNHVRSSVRAIQGDAACQMEGPTAAPADLGSVRVALTFVCPRPIAQAATRLEIRLFEGISPGHIHYVRIDGPTPIEAALSQANATIAVSGPAGPGSFFGFVASGTEHVLGGFDHLAFLAALALLAGTAWRVALAATGFTIGHSITLGLVTFGVVTPNEAAVEMLIGFTIAFAAAEALGGTVTLRRALAIAGIVLALPLAAQAFGFSPPPLPVYLGAAVFAGCASLIGAERARRGAPVLAGLFGLVHGAGFAGALGVLKLPPDRIVPALFGFNVGVELGQLIALGVLGLAAALASRAPPSVRPLLRDGFAAILIGLGTYWFAERTFVAL